MNWRQRHLTAEAVYFFRGDDIIHAMRYDAFREHLLGGRPFQSLAGDTMRGIYVAVGDRLDVRAACCFLLTFDRDGIAAPDWNVPLRELAHNSGVGPDLGHGETRLACRAQCSIPWHVNRLWGADLDEVSAALQNVQRTVARNVPSLRSEERSATLRSVAPGRTPRLDVSEDPSMAQTAELPPIAMARAARRFDTTFGERPRLDRQQVEAARSGAAAADSSPEIARLKAKHQKEVEVLKAEIRRLRQLVTAVART